MLALLQLIIISVFLINYQFAFGANCSEAYEKLEKASSDEQSLRTLNEAYPDCEGIDYTLGDYYFEKKVYVAANEIYAKLFSRFPDDEELEEKLKKIQELTPQSINEPEIATRGFGKRTSNRPIFLPIEFATNSSSLSKDAKIQVDKLATMIKRESSNYRFEIQGHTDSDGNPDVNLKLSKGRAESVANYLKTAHNIPSDKLLVSGSGAGNPIDTNLTSEGKDRNRRVQAVRHKLK